MPAPRSGPEAPSETPFWAFSVALYDRPGVADACLRLQDRDAVDVNLLLLGVWLGHEGRLCLAKSDLDRLDAQIAAWRTEAILPLRSLRRRLKSGPPPAPSAGTEVLRSVVKAAELEAERLAQDVLYTAVAGMELAPGGDDAVGRNMALIVGRARGASVREDDPDIAAVLAALQPSFQR